MNIRRAIIIAFLPPVGTIIYLGIVASMTLIQFIIVESKTSLQLIIFVLGYLFLALSLKLILGAIFGIFIGCAGDKIPRGAMLLLAFILIASGMFLLAPLLCGYVV